MKNNGVVDKGNDRNYRLGDSKCDENTIVGYLGYHYFCKQDGDSIFDPVFILCGVLDWAGIAWNRRGNICLTTEFKNKCHY